LGGDRDYELVHTPEKIQKRLQMFRRNKCHALDGFAPRRFVKRLCLLDLLRRDLFKETRFTQALVLR
jgi:hypothetical protein